MNKKRLELKRVIETGINQLSLEGLVNLNDFVIADHMLRAFDNLINTIEHNNILKGRQPRADRNNFVNNLEG